MNTPDLARVLYFLPAPARAKAAQELHKLGVRVHPELATHRLESTGAAWMGNHAPQRLVRIDRDQALEVLETMSPQAAQDARDAYAELDSREQARTDAREMLREELTAKVGGEMTEAIMRHADRFIEEGGA